MIDYDPLIIFQAAFGHHQMHVWFTDPAGSTGEGQVTPKGVGGVDHADADVRAEVGHQFTDGLNRRLQEHLQE